MTEHVGSRLKTRFALISTTAQTTKHCVVVLSTTTPQSTPQTEALFQVVRVSVKFLNLAPTTAVKENQNSKLFL
jgi:hypothetical protein